MIRPIVAYGNPDTWTLNELRPYFDHVVSVFGPNRLVWGSDSPVCNLGAKLETWVAVTRALCNDWSMDDKEALFYMQSRGIDRESASSLLIRGFVNELMEEIDKKDYI